MANTFSVGRHAQCSVTLANSAGSVGSSVYFPAGAIITGLTILAPSAVTITDAAATVQPRIGSTPIGVTQSISTLPAVSEASTINLVRAYPNDAGIYLASSGEFNVSCQASSVSSATASYNYYVDYIVPV